MSTAKQIFDAAFSKPRDPRSEAYKDGVLRTLGMRLREFDLAPGDTPKQYVLGTAECDAYFAGCDEGHRLASEYQEKVGAGRTVPNDRVERPCAASGARSARTTGCAAGGED